VKRPLLLGLLLLASRALPAVDNATLRAHSVFVESEDFTPSNGDWKAGEGWADDIYSATSGNAVLSNGGGSGTATREVAIPTAGAYNVWVRYLKIGEYPGTFGLRITQGGAVVLDGEYRAKPTGTGWDPIWEKLPVQLQAGPATLTLYLAKPGIRQHVDCVLLTSALDYEPDYRDFGPQTFLRFRLLSPAVAAKAKVSVYMRREPIWYHFPGIITATGLGPDGDPVPAGQWSPWVELSKYLDAAKWEATVKLAFTAAGKPLDRVKVDYQVAPVPDESKAVALHEDLDGDLSSLILPGNMTKYPAAVTLASALSAKHYQRARALHFPPQKQTLIPIETYITGWGDAYNSERVLGWEMGGAAAAGLNSFNQVYGKRYPVSAGVGVKRGYLSEWFPYQLWNCPTDPGNAKLADESFAGIARKMLAEDPAALTRHYRNTLYDEPGTSDLKHLAECPSCLAGFGKYLQTQGLKPADFGRESWEGLKPIARDAATDALTRKLHYWSIQYRDWTNASVVKLGSDSCRKHFGPQMLTMVNFTDGPMSGWGSGMVEGPDWFLYGRMQSTTLLWSEDWTAVGPEVSGLIVDTLRAAARPHHLAVGEYIIANHQRTMPQRTWSALMHGAKILHYYCWGPYYSFADGMISDNLETQKIIGRVTRDLAQVDPVLYPAQVPPAQVALLWGKSHEIWQNDSAVGAERRMTYMALQHAHVPVDIVSEDDLADGILKGYKALYLTESNLKRAAAEKVVAWVKAGGVLQMSAGAGVSDEYNEPLTDLTDLAGVKVATVDKPGGDYREHYGIPATQPKGEVQLAAGPYWSASKFPVLGYTEQAEAAGATVLATFADGKPAVTLNRAGKGAVLRFAFMPGLGYVKSAKVVPTDTITGFDPRQLSALVAAVKLAKVVTPLVVSEPLVEAQLLRGPKAEVVMLANWGYEDVPNLKVTIRGAAAKRITTTSGAPLRMSRNANDVTVTLRIHQTEVLVLRR
jgi:hypothetical protein